MAKKITVESLPRYRLIIFDFDGTLVNSAPSMYYTVNKMAKAHKLGPITMKKVTASVGAGLNVFLEKVFPSLLETMTPEELKKDYVRRYRRFFTRGVKIYPGVRETLRCLKKKKIKMVIISNKAREFINGTNKYLGINKYFARVFGRGDFNKDKPHPLPFFEMMKIYRVKKREALMVGDSIYDIKGAKNAGIDSYFLTYGYGSRAEVMKLKPTYTSNNIKGLKIKAKY